MLSVKTCLHWFVRIAWLVGCSLGLFVYLCSTEPGFTCANSLSEPSYQETKNGYVSWWPSSHEIRRCMWELKRMAQKVLQRTRGRKARATSFSCHHFTLYLHRQHLLSHSFSSSQILVHPELAPSGPSASRWRTLLSQPPHPLAADCGVESTIDLTLSRCSCWFCAGLDLVSC